MTWKYALDKRYWAEEFNPKYGPLRPAYPPEEPPVVVAIIPARGGSKGVPRKNVRPLCGKPLIAYSIEAALRSRLVHRVIVSTDDEEIAGVSRECGAEVPFLRPEAISTDNASLADVFAYTINRLYKDRADQVATVSLYPTSPFRTPALIDFLTRKVLEGCSYVSTVKRIPPSARGPFFRDGDRLARLDKLRDACPHYRGYGVYSGSTRRRGDRYVHVLNDPIQEIDIDTFEDFHLAEEVVRAGLFDFGLEAGA